MLISCPTDTLCTGSLVAFPFCSSLFEIRQEHLIPGKVQNVCYVVLSQAQTHSFAFSATTNHCCGHMQVGKKLKKFEKSKEFF